MTAKVYGVSDIVPGGAVTIYTGPWQGKEPKDVRRLCPEPIGKLVLVVFKTDYPEVLPGHYYFDRRLLSAVLAPLARRGLFIVSGELFGDGAPDVIIAENALGLEENEEYVLVGSDGGAAGALYLWSFAGYTPGQYGEDSVVAVIVLEEGGVDALASAMEEVCADHNVSCERVRGRPM